MTTNKIADTTSAVEKATAALDELRKVELKVREDLRQEPANVEFAEALRQVTLEIDAAQSQLRAATERRWEVMRNDQPTLDAATGAVVKARAALAELQRIERLLETELPAAQAALASAEKHHQMLTKPGKAAIREAELQLLQRKLNEARGGAQNV